MKKNRAKKLGMFRAGATALRQYIGTDKYYFCPLCLYGFREEALDTNQLTIEHVPPEKLGGRGMLLTCRDCNNFSGRVLDSEMVARDHVRRFHATVLGQESTYQGPATLEAGGERLNIEMYRNGKFVVLADNNRRNHPALAQRMLDHGLLDGRVTSGVRYHQRRAAIGDLRVAYLAAFALLGYRYAFHPAFDIIRQQIAEPESEFLSRFSFPIAAGASVARRIFEFPDLHCVAVQIDRVVVLLPVPGRSDTLYEQLAKIYGEEKQGRFLDADNLGWPQGLELREDYGISRLQFPPLLRGELVEA